MDPTVRQVRAFVTVVEEGTFTDAAIALHTSQATVSRAVAGLEEAVGARLLRRTPRSVTLTQAGKRVLGHATRMLAEADRLQQSAQTPADAVRLGYAWSALGRHTTEIQRRWGRAHPRAELELVLSNTPTAGLLEGLADASVIRVPLHDPRFDTALVGLEGRYAAIAADDPLARRRKLRLADFDGRVVGMDVRTGSTSQELWAASPVQVTMREVHGVEEWLTLIGSGQVIGMTAEATVWQHPRPGIVYRPVSDAEPIAVRIAWWRDEPPAGLTELLEMARAAYSA